MDNIKAYKIYWLIDTLEAELKGMDLINIKDRETSAILTGLEIKCTMARKKLDKVLNIEAELCGHYNDVLNDLIDLELKKLELTN